MVQRSVSMYLGNQPATFFKRSRQLSLSHTFQNLSSIQELRHGRFYISAVGVFTPLHFHFHLRQSIGVFVSFTLPSLRGRREAKIG